jgi:cytidyltransferase-like protein
MKNLKNISEYLTEKRVIVKRKYTEQYPAKLASTYASVRNSLFNAMSDGVLTEEELLKILAETNVNKRWLSRNISLFNVSEDENGIKRYSLSKFGQRIHNATVSITEALNVPHKERGKKPVNIFVGRFQPFTLGHVKVFEQMYKKNGHPVIVFLVRGGKPDPEKRPFDEDLQQAMFAEMAKQYPFLEAAFVVPNGGIDTLFATARPAYEPMMWGYGTDRKKAYDFMIDKPEYRSDLGVDQDFTGFEITRTDDDVSASKVRNALIIDDESTFKKMTPKSIHKFYKTLQDTLQPIKENYNMKNLKSLNEFNSANKYKETNEVNERNTKLYVYPSSKKDHQMISNWLERSDFYAEEDSNSFMFPVSNQRDADATEKDLDKEFTKLGANAKFVLESQS